MAFDASHYHWMPILVMAVLAMVFGGLGLCFISLKMYRTKSLASFLFGGMLANLFTGLFFSWGVLYFISDVIVDVVSFENRGLDDGVLLIALVFAIVLSNTISLFVLIKRNIDGVTITNDLFQKDEGTEKQAEI